MLQSAARQAPLYVDSYAQLAPAARTAGAPFQYFDAGSVITTDPTQDAMYQALYATAPIPSSPSPQARTVLPVGAAYLAQSMADAVDDAFTPSVTTAPYVANLDARNGTNIIENGGVVANGDHTSPSGFSLPFGLKGWHALLIIGGLIATGAVAYRVARR